MKARTTYLYTTDSGWELMLLRSLIGWGWLLRNPNNIAIRHGTGWESKTSALKIALDSLEELAKTREIVLIKSLYEYPTSPKTKIWSYNSKWRWKKGASSGEENTKAQALKAAVK